MIQKVVIPAAGLGTRLLPATKEQPKEMLSIFALCSDGRVCLKPLVQLVFEQLYDTGFRKFCFIIGRGKRAIEDHFTPDYEYFNMLKNMSKTGMMRELQNFYDRIESSTMVWVNQPRPKGFGDAVLKTQPFVGDEAFLVQAGDTYITSSQNQHLKRLMEMHEEYGSDITFLVQEVEDPRQHGVVETEEEKTGIYKVNQVIEKPERPPTNLAIIPVYIFHPVIFKALETTRPGKGGEIQLTDAIQKVIEWGLKVYAVELDIHETRLDIGNPETYWDAIRLSYQHVCI